MFQNSEGNLRLHGLYQLLTSNFYQGVASMGAMLMWALRKPKQPMTDDEHECLHILLDVSSNSPQSGTLVVRRHILLAP